VRPGRIWKPSKSDFDAVFGTIPAGAGEVGTAIADLNTRLGLTGKPLQKYGDFGSWNFPGSLGLMLPRQ